MRFAPLPKKIHAREGPSGVGMTRRRSWGLDGTHLVVTSTICHVIGNEGGPGRGPTRSAPGWASALSVAGRRHHLV